MPGLGLANEFISRDEALHQEFGCALYRHLRLPLARERVLAIVEGAVAAEKEFITGAIPCRMVGMNQDDMAQYIEFVANRVLMDLGYDRHFRQGQRSVAAAGAPAPGGSFVETFVSNPFPWMELISMQGKTNFFEKRVGEYQKAGVMSAAAGHARTLEFDQDF